MTFSKKTNCECCGSPLHLQDIQSNIWNDDVNEFVFCCSNCKKINIINFKLFDKIGHIRRSYLSILKDDKDFLRGEQLSKVSQHLEVCSLCRSKMDEEYLNEIEEKIRFNERTLQYFNNFSQEINQQVNSLVNDSQVVSFCYDNIEYEIKEEDEFFRKSEGKLKIYYYLRENIYLVGMASLIIDNNNVILDRLWLRSKELLEKEKLYLNQIREGKIKIKLETLGIIFKALHN